MTKTPRLIYVKYVDHVQFRNTDPHRLEPCIREVVGWLVKETKDALYLTYDRSVEPMPFEKRECGFIILKSDIFERKKIE